MYESLPNMAKVLTWLHKLTLPISSGQISLLITAVVRQLNISQCGGGRHYLFVDVFLKNYFILL